MKSQTSGFRLKGRSAGRLVGALGLLLALCLVVGGVLPAYAQPPPIPHAFYGDVRINGTLAAEGTAVESYVGGVPKESTTVDNQGNYSLLVSGTAGATVTFHVGGKVANETAPWQSGAVDELNLTVPGYDLTVDSTAGGSVTDPGEGLFTYDAATAVDLLAAPDAGYQFENWTGDTGAIDDVNAADTFITMNGNYDITANFELIPPPTAQKLLGADDAAALGPAGGQYLVLDRSVALATGYVTQIRVKCTNDGNVKVALYTDNAGSPGTLLSANNTGASVVAGGWNNIPITPTAVTTGTFYWIAYISSVNCVGYFSSPGGGLVFKALSYTSSFPASAGTGFTTSTGNHSLTAGWGVAGPFPLTITTTSLPDGAAGIAYSQILQAVGGSGTYTWSISVGSLPPGLTVTPSTGVIAGSPTTAGTFNFTAQVNDVSTTASQPLFITVTDFQKLLGADDAVAVGPAGGNFLVLDRSAAVGTGNVTRIRVKCTGSGSVKVALYTDDAGSPGTLLNANNTGASCVAGWNNITIPSTAVTIGTNYWIAYNSSTNCVGYFSSPGGGLVFRSLSYASVFPPLAGGGFITSPGNHSLTAGCCVMALPPAPTPDFTNLTFRWNSSTGASNYHLQVNTQPDFTGTDMFNGEVGNVTSREVTGLTGGNTYYYRVQAGNEMGWSSWCSTGSIHCQ